MNEPLFPETTSSSSSVYSADFINAIFSKIDLTSGPLDSSELLQGIDAMQTLSNEAMLASPAHRISIFEDLMKEALASNSQASYDDAHQSGKCSKSEELLPSDSQDHGSSSKSDLVYLAVPTSLIEQSQGLSVEEVKDGIERMREVVRQLTVENLLTFKTNISPEETCPNDDADAVRFPTYENGRCLHKRCWKRLRAKRGYAYFVCLQCGLKWRCTSQSEKLRKQTLVSLGDS